MLLFVHGFVVLIKLGGFAKWRHLIYEKLHVPNIAEKHGAAAKALWSSMCLC